ncbi:MAG: hypothetical protein HC880_08635 [Bacteroidia bacterium]|nr:hypothetical protein [Bacteroidia bacterium]
MLKRQDIICVARPNWDGNYAKSTVELMKALARHNRVLYVDYQATFKDLLGAILKKNYALIKRLVGIKNRLREVKLTEDTSVYRA